MSFLVASRRSIGRAKDYDGDGRITEFEVLRWNDEALGGRGFKNWTKYNHPQLGEVEIGGYNPKFVRQNPPAEFLEEWAGKEALFNLMLAKSLPQVKILSAEARPVKNLFDLSCVVTNEGFLPTVLKIAEWVKIVRPDWVEVKLPKGAELEAGFKTKIEIGHLKSGEKKEVRWRFKVKPAIQGSSAETKAAVASGPKTAQLEAEVSVFSTRGGLDKKKVQIATQ